MTNESFQFDETYCSAPSLLVFAYALAVAFAGSARRILLAGFDGYAQGDLKMKKLRMSSAL